MCWHGASACGCAVGCNSTCSSLMHAVHLDTTGLPISTACCQHCGFAEVELQRGQRNLSMCTAGTAEAAKHCM
jgi:hypothetical protein